MLQHLFEGDYDEGAILRDIGIKMSVDHADSVNPNWSGDAFDILVSYCGDLPAGTNVTGERIRQYAESCGLPTPPDKRAWGAVLMRAAKSGIIMKNGTTTANDPKVHKNVVTNWKICSSSLM